MKKVIIIGAGIAGLTAAIYARKNGFDVEVYEMHTIPGGECTGWNRGGYHFDNCIHWLTGTKPGSGLYKLWQTVGALEGIDTYTASEFVAVKTGDVEVHMYQDIEKLRQHLKEISKEDAEAIDTYCEMILKIQQMNMPVEKPMEALNLLDYMRLWKEMKGALSLMPKLSKQYIEDYVSKFKHPALRRAISMDMERVNSHAPPFAMGIFSAGNGAWPMGGSLAMVKRMEKCAKDLGCKIYYKQKVKRILIKETAAIGIELEDGKVVTGDYIVPSNDLYVTLHNFLDGHYSDAKIDRYYRELEKHPGQTTVSIGVGVSCDLGSRPEHYSVEIEPFECGGKQIKTMAFKHFAYQKDFAPEGHSVLMIQIPADYKYWKALKEQGDAYDKAKMALEENIRRTLENVYEETKGHIEVVNIATPLTYERYCGAYRGSWMPFVGNPETKNFIHNGKLKGIKNLYLAGQWLYTPGGLPSAAATGRWAIWRICKKEKQTFID